MTSAQWSEWKSYYEIEPFGEYRSELRHGQVMQLLDAAHFKHDGPPKKVSSFMNFKNEPEIEMTPEQINECFKGLFGARS